MDDLAKKTSPKDVFLHLLAIISLYVSAGAFLSLAFDYINLGFPDALEGSYAADAALSSIRFAISALVIVFPTYFFTTRFLNKSYEKNTGLRNLRIRKWLIYFTLFVAALIVIGDFIALVYGFLNGDLTARFGLKALAIFFTAVSVFLYYFWDVKKYKTE